MKGPVAWFIKQDNSLDKTVDKKLTKISDRSETEAFRWSDFQDIPREYRTTHPWLTFAIPVGCLDEELWLLLGEAKSKIAHVSSIPMRGDTARELHKLYFSLGVRGTLAIEGNSLTLGEIQSHMQESESGHPPSQDALFREVSNMTSLHRWILSEGKQLIPWTEKTFLQIQGRVLQGTGPQGTDPNLSFRTHDVRVGHYHGAPKQDCPTLIRKLCEWLSGSEFEPSSPEFSIPRAILKGLFAHLYTAWIHPFSDGNGRTARALEFLALTQAGIPAACAFLPSNHYHRTRPDYYAQLDQSSKPNGIESFLKYAVRGLVEGLRLQIDTIMQQQLDLAWADLVRERLHPSAGKVQARQAMLLTELPDRPVRAKDIPLLTPLLAKTYAETTIKTLSRDLNALVAQNLLIKSSEGYRPNRQIMSQFLPEFAST